MNDGKIGILDSDGVSFKAALDYNHVEAERLVIWRRYPLKLQTATQRD